MKMIFFERYVYEDGVFVGKGKKVSGDIQNYLESTPFSHKEVFTLHPKVIKNNKNSFRNNDYLWDIHQVKVRRLLKYSDEAEYKSLLDKRLVEFWFGFLGPIGRNDFEYDGKNYICSNFKFDREWFEKEYKKLSRLRKSFYEYHGLETEIEFIPDEMEKLLSKEWGIPNKEEWDKYKALSEFQKDIIVSYYKNEELSLEEQKFFEKITDEEKQIVKKIHFKAELTVEEKNKLKQFSLRKQKGLYYKKQTFLAKQDPKTKKEFIEALNDVMHNVREFRYWNEENESFYTIQVPINCFGYYALFALQSLKTNKGYYNCEGCGYADFFNHKSIKMCDRCKAAKRKRKSYIKQDILNGLTLEEIKIKRTRMEPKEIIELYNVAQKEIMKN